MAYLAIITVNLDLQGSKRGRWVNIAEVNVPKSDRFFVSGGTMPLDSGSYIERASDKALFEGLMSGKYCYVLNSRQMGKSSLSVRIISKLEQAGVRTAPIDLTRIGGKNVTAAQWYAGLCDAIGTGLGLNREMLDYYRQNTMLGPMQRFFGAIENVALKQIEQPIVVFIDEIDTTKNLSFEADEFFAGIRECYNRRVQDPIFERLSFCLIGVAVPSDLINNPSTTPFNIGERIQLNDFTLKEMRALAPALGPNGESFIERIHEWTGGQPFLTQSLCEAVSQDSQFQSASQIDTVVQTMFLERRARATNINLSDVGDRALNAGSAETNPDRFRAKLLSAYEKALRGGSLPDDESNRVAVILKLSGLMKSDGRRLQIRNRIYREVFDRKWVEDNMPERELHRERQAFRRGIIRAASASAAVVVVVCGLGLYAWKSKNDAVDAQRALDYEIYVADMNNMKLLENSGDVSRMEELLGRRSNSPHRGFEWNYWLGRIHDSNEEYTLDYSAPGKREEGCMSQDGRSIGIYDSLLGVAAVIDRKTKKTVAVRQVGTKMRMVATRAGFATVSATKRGIETRSVTTGELIATIASGINIVNEPAMGSRSDFGLAVLADPKRGGIHDIKLWDLVAGKATYSLHTEEQIPQSPLAANEAGTKILMGAPRVPGTQGVPPAWIVRDTSTDKVIDSFQVPPGSVLQDYSDSGRLVLYSDGNHTTICRDVVQRRDIYRRIWDGSDISISSVVTSDDTAFAERYGNGRATLTNLADGKVATLGQNVWNLAAAGSKTDLLASSTSVRILRPSESDYGRTVAIGTRLARDDSGGIAVFREKPTAILHYSDPALQFQGQIDAPPRLRNGYTYNGRWRLSVDETGKVGLFAEADGRQPPLRLTPIPANYSCGETRDSLVVLDAGGMSLSGVNGVTGKVNWTNNVSGTPINGLWVSPRGDTALALQGDVQLLAFDVKSGRLRDTLGGHNVRLSNLTFTRDQTKFFTCGSDGRVILWDLDTLQKVQEFRGNVAQRMSSADLSPDGSRVATCNFTGSWQLWDVKTGVQLMDTRGSALPLRSVVFNADGHSILTAGEDRQIRKWSTLAKDPSVKVRVAPVMLRGIKR